LCIWMEELVVVHLEVELELMEEMGCMGIGMAGKGTMACCKR
jgi:hypothetical protein